MVPGLYRTKPTLSRRYLSLLASQRMACPDRPRLRRSSCRPVRRAAREGEVLEEVDPSEGRSLRSLRSRLRGAEPGQRGMGSTTDVVWTSSSLSFLVLWIRTIPGGGSDQHSPCESRSPMSGVPLMSNDGGATPSASSCSLQETNRRFWTTGSGTDPVETGPEPMFFWSTSQM